MPTVLFPFDLLNLKYLISRTTKPQKSYAEHVAKISLSLRFSLGPGTIHQRIDALLSPLKLQQRSP